MRLVDADALKEWVETEEERRWGLSTDEVWDAINAAPTIDPVKHGKWGYREVRDYPLGFDVLKCSECGWETSSNPSERQDEHRADYAMKTFKYCPACGARMDL